MWQTVARKISEKTWSKWFHNPICKNEFPLSLEILVHRHHRIKLSSAINSSAALLGLCGSKIASRFFSQPNFAQIYQNSRHSSRHSKIQRAPRDLDSGILQAPTKFKEFHKLRKKAACQIKDLNMQSASSWKLFGTSGSKIPSEPDTELFESSLS